MILSKRQRWTLMAGVAGMLGVQLAEQLMASSWRFARRKDPPFDPEYQNESWKAALLWTAGIGALAGVSDLMARRGAALVWTRATGSKPPRPRKKGRRG